VDRRARLQVYELQLGATFPVAVAAEEHEWIIRITAALHLT
jgi:hypothetical protein